MNLKVFSNLFVLTLLSSTINLALSSKSIAREITVTIEDPGIQRTQLPNASEYYVIDFDDLSGAGSFSKTHGTTTFNYSGDLQVKEDDQFGGANVSKFITQNQDYAGYFMESYKITMDEDQKYFGFWWSAGDPYNDIKFKKDGVVVASLRTADLYQFINDSGVVDTSNYLGNPNPIYDTVDGVHKNEPFSYVNVFFGDSSGWEHPTF